MDPLSITTSIGGVLTIATSLSKSMIGTVDSIRDSPKYIKALSSDTKAMFVVLGTLSGYLSEEDTATGVLHDVIVADLREVLSNSTSVLTELQLILNDRVDGEDGEDGEDGDKEVGKWKRSTWHLKEDQIQRWREQLTAHKTTLSVTVAMANMINTNTAA
ncbi:Cytochrome c oxidase subunit 1 [Hypoxylon texense]